MDLRPGTIGTAITLALAGPAAGLARGQPVPAPAATGVTLVQYQQRGEQRVMAADTDGDGRVSRAEFVAAGTGRGDPAARFARLDANGDGVIDRQEIDAVLAQRFHRLDADGNGMLTPQERTAMHRHRSDGRPGGAKDGVPDAPSA